MDKVVDDVDWSTTRAGLLQGVQELQTSIDDVVEAVLHKDPCMVEDGHSVLWQSRNC